MIRKHLQDARIDLVINRTIKEQITEIASRKGVRYQHLIKAWIYEQISREMETSKDE